MGIVGSQKDEDKVRFDLKDSIIAFRGKTGVPFQAVKAAADEIAADTCIGNGHALGKAEFDDVDIVSAAVVVCQTVSQEENPTPGNSGYFF